MKENLLSSLSEEINLELERARRIKKLPLSDSDKVRRDFLAEDFQDQAPNIYEAIIVMSQRARQIGQKQARIIEQFMASRMRNDESEEEEEVVRSIDDDDDDEPRVPKFEKPTILAMNEMHLGEIKYRKND